MHIFFLNTICTVSKKMHNIMWGMGLQTEPLPVCTVFSYSRSQLQVWSIAGLIRSISIVAYKTFMRWRIMNISFFTLEALFFLWRNDVWSASTGTSTVYLCVHQHLSPPHIRVILPPTLYSICLLFFSYLNPHFIDASWVTSLSIL